MGKGGGEPWGGLYLQGLILTRSPPNLATSRAQQLLHPTDVGLSTPHTPQRVGSPGPPGGGPSPSSTVPTHSPPVLGQQVNGNKCFEPAAGGGCSHPHPQAGPHGARKG